MARLVKRGQVWTANLNPGFGVEIHKKRPVLIISSNEINQYSPNIIVIPISSQTKPYGPEKILLPKITTGLKKESAALAPEIRAVDKRRLIKKIGSVEKEKLLEVEDSLRLVLGMIELD